MVRTVSPLIGRTWQTVDVLSALGLIVVVIEATQSSTRGIGRAVVIIAPLAQRLWVEGFVVLVVSKAAMPPRSCSQR